MSSSPGSAICAKGIRHSLGARFVLGPLELAIEPGELFGIVGPNGAGKSTLLRLLLGMLPFQQGSVTIFGQSVLELDPRARARLIAYVPQGHTRELSFTVEEMVSMGRNPHIGRFEPLRKEDRAAIESALEAVKLMDLAACRFAELSGGEQQRVVLARSLAQETPILMLDEPIANLDLKHALQILDIVRARTEEKQGAVLVALHDLDLAARFCDRLLVLSGGRPEGHGKPKDVLTSDRLAQVFGLRARLDGEEGQLFVRVEGRWP